MNTKLLVGLVLLGILAVAAIGLVSAQIGTPTPNGTTNNAFNGFFGWVGRCFGLRGTPYYGASGIAPNQSLPANITVTNPYTNQTTTYQGYAPYQAQPANITITNPYTGQTTTYQALYGYGYGTGQCMRGWVP